ncbi:TPA_asm: L [Ipomoea betacytorhabdovirus 1]|nr:TPA_asm: L [Ipomoea betacytorhabdovirus 1]
MEDFEDLSEFFKSNPMRGLGDFHLRSALQDVDLLGLKTGKGKNREKRSFNALSRHHNPENLVTCDLARLFTLLIRTQESNKIKNLDRAHPLLLSALKTEYQALNKMMSKEDPFKKSIGIIEKETMASCYTILKRELISGLMHILAKTSGRTPVISGNMSPLGDIYIHKLGEFSFYYWGELITVVSNFSKSVQVLTVDHYRMICDKVTERDNVLIATRIGNNLFPLVYPEESLIKAIFDLFDDYLFKSGNDGYKELKAYEAIVTGVILERGPKRFVDSELFLRSTLSGFEGEGRKVLNEFIKIIRGVPSIHHLTQICGLFRLWGHPIIDSQAGVRKVRVIGKSKRTINHHVVKESERSFKEIFSSEFYAKHGRYPIINILETKEGSYLQKCLTEQVPFRSNSLEYDRSDWDVIDLGKTFDVPETFNLSMIVADTAISPTRSELRRSGDQGIPAMNPLERRGVLKWMKDGVIDCKTLLEKINRCPTGLPLEHLAIGLYPKEREMNPVARMFALTTLLLRSYIVVTESMLSNHIVDYIPGVTMTHSLLKLTKEMIKITWRQRTDSEISRSFCLNMDFEKWNLNMRKESTYGVFRQLGLLFGMENLYNRTYDMFENSLIYLADGSYVPKLNENLQVVESNEDYAYTGHIGGFEGLRQKGWTIFTVVIISYICKRLKIDWKLMGQGDNQVLVVTIYSRYARKYGLNSPQSVSDIEQQLRALMEMLIQEFGAVSLPLKPLETWTSDCFFSYGKTPLFKGLPCAMSLKKLSRVFYFSNEDLMTIDNALGAVGANAQSAVMADVHPVIPYILAKWQQITCLVLFRAYHPLVGKGLLDSSPHQFVMYDPNTKRAREHTVSWAWDHDTEIILMASLPKTLGGYNTMNYFRMMMRGFADPQNMDLQWINAMTEAAEGNLKTGFLNLRSLMINPQVNYTYLIQDVTGLNLYLPTNSTQVIKDMIHSVIDELNFQSDFSTWFDTVLKHSKKENIEPLVEQLCIGDTLNVRFLHDILGSTLYGYCDSITSKIDKTVTLSRMALGQNDVVGSLAKNEVRFFRYMRWRTTVPGNFPFEGCPTNYLKNVRNKGWKKKILGVGVPFPFHYLSKKESENLKENSYVEVTTNEMAVLNPDHVVCQMGSALPYLGSITKEKLGTNLSRLSYGNEPLITRPINLLRTIGWFIQDGSNYAQLLKHLVQAVSNVDPEKFIVSPDKVKGSAEHRYQDDAIKHGSLWMTLYGPASYLHLSTNSFTEFSKGSKNVNLHFQSLLCYIQYLSVNDMFSLETQKYKRFFRCCDNCITPLEEDFPDLEIPIDVSLIPCQPENPYLFVRDESIPLEIKYLPPLVTSFNVCDLNSLHYSFIYHSLENWFSINLASQLIKGRDDSTDQGLLDVGGLPRTLYLKLNPHRIEQITLNYLWIYYARQPKYSSEGTFPAWDIVKEDIRRTLSRTPSSQYMLLSGFLLWESSKSLYESSCRVHIKTYPMTATSMSEACKTSLLASMQDKNAGELIAKDTMLILPSYESQLDTMIKMVSILRVERSSKCVDCIKTIIFTGIHQKTRQDELLTIQCQSRHYSFQGLDLKKIYRTPFTPVESVLDFVPNLPLQRISKVELRIELARSEIRPIISHRDNWEYCDNDEEIEMEEFGFHSKYLGIHLMFAQTTRGMYRAWEVASYFDSGELGNTLVLGDGLGGTSFGISMSDRADQIHAWTYIDLSSGIPHSADLSRPPLHYTYEQKVNTRYSFTKNSILGRPGFKEDFFGVVEDESIKTVLSDIEWWYLGDDLSLDLIDLCHAGQIHRIILRVFLSDTKLMIKMINKLSAKYSKWEFAYSSTVCPSSNSMWCIATQPTPIEEVRRLDIRSQIVAINRIIIRSNEYLAERTNRVISESLDKNLLTVPSWMKLHRQMLDEYFSEVGLHSYKEPVLTKMFFELKTGRRPAEVSHMGDNTLYFDRDDSRHALLKRLLLLACSMLRDIEDAYEVVMRDWELNWTSKMSSSFDIRRYARTNVRIQSSSRVQSRLTQRDRREILSRVKLLQVVRNEREEGDRDRPGLYNVIGKSITFRYIPHKERDYHEVYFPISKIASYST